VAAGDGGFEIPGVPAGLRYVEMMILGQANEVWTASNRVDLGWTEVGRKSGSRLGPSTFVSMNLGKHSSYASSDQLTLVSVGAQLATSVTAMLGADAGSLVGTVNLSNALAVAPALGDTVFALHQTVGVAGSGCGVRRTVEATAPVSGFTPVSGATTSFSAPFLAGGLSQVEVFMRTGDYAAVQPCPGASGGTLNALGVVIEANANVGGCGPLCGGVALTSVACPVTPAVNQPVPTTVLDVGLSRRVTTAAGYSCTLPRPDGGTVAEYANLLSIRAFTDGGVDSAPGLLPPQAITFTPGAVPTLEWKSADAGTVVRVIRLAEGQVPEFTTGSLVADGPVRSLTLPPGLVEPGREHVFAVTAVSSGGSASLVEQPASRVLPYASATAYSSVVKAGPSRSCAFGAVQPGPRGGPDSCTYGDVCASGGTCQPAPAAACPEAAGFPAWSFTTSPPGPFLLEASTGAVLATQCGGDGGLGVGTVVTLKYIAPAGFPTPAAVTATVRGGGGSMPYTAISTPPGAAAKWGTLGVLVCSALETVAVQIDDGAGHRSNVLCVGL